MESLSEKEIERNGEVNERERESKYKKRESVRECVCV